MTTPNQHARAVRVPEVGLPRIRHHGLAEELGRRLLLATDLTDASRAAEERAIELAVAGPRALLILAVVATDDAAEPARTRLHTLVDIARWRGALVRSQLVVSDDPAEAILHAVDSDAADAIVIGHASWCERDTAVCGHLANTAPCPILAIGAHAA